MIDAIDGNVEVSRKHLGGWGDTDRIDQAMPKRVDGQVAVSQPRRSTDGDVVIDADCHAQGWTGESGSVRGMMNG